MVQLKNNILHLSSEDMDANGYPYEEGVIDLNIRRIANIEVDRTIKSSEMSRNMILTAMMANPTKTKIANVFQQYLSKLSQRHFDTMCINILTVPRGSGSGSKSYEYTLRYKDGGDLKADYDALTLYMGQE